MDQLYENNVPGPTMPPFRARHATPLLETRAIACYMHVCAGLSEHLPAALNG